MARRARKASLELRPGDLVLLGAPGKMMPRDWHRGVVVWSDGTEILVRQWGFGGQGSWLLVYPIEQVRAVGDHAFLTEFQERCRAEVKTLERAISEAEQAAAAARAGIWKKLDEIGASAPARQPEAAG
jgi:hypothetical protein